MLDQEIESARRLVKTDAYQMSIGEIVNMYKDAELVINPDFQRLFRWEIGQKAKLIESILLGIPLPPIFVFEKANGTWELIDGLQRVSTLLEFMGQLKDPASGQLKAPTALVGTKYLPSLHRAVWELSEQIAELPSDEQAPLSLPLQLAIRRSRFGVEILKRPSDSATKYDLFQRLNAGGVAANAQELRNCIIIMINPTYFQFVRDLANYPPFRNVLSASPEQLEKQRDVEYVSRFLVHTYTRYSRPLDVEEYIDESIIELAEGGETENANNVFKWTFDLLERAHGGNALRKFEAGIPTGRVLLSAFECIAIGIARNIANIRAKALPSEYVHQRILDLWASPEASQFSSGGMPGTTRIRRTLPFGEAWFAT